MSTSEPRWNKPQAMAIPKEGYFKLEQGNYGPIFPQTPINYGFTIIAKVKPGKEDAVRAYANTIEGRAPRCAGRAVAAEASFVEMGPFEIDKGLYFMYQGIFDHRLRHVYR